MLAGTAVVLRLVVSPAVARLATSLAMRRDGDPASNGRYPARAVDRRTAVPVGLVLATASAGLAIVPAPPLGVLNDLRVAVLALLLWKYLTQDLDAARPPGWQVRDRLLVLVVGLTATVLPGLTFAAVVLVCGRLGAWTHHAKAPVRVLKIFTAWTVVAAVAAATGRVPAEASLAALLMLQIVAFLSHYVSACWHKLALGRRPWSWAAENDTGLLVAAAYEWGWARWVPRRVLTGAAAAISRCSRPLNAATLVLEGAGLVAFASPRLCVLAIGCAAGFNLVVALTSGLLFWDNVLTGVALAVVVAVAPTALSRAAFGPGPELLGLIALAAVITGVLWRPTVLAWWDTGLTTRVYWKVITADGRALGLYNTFLSPHDREYGRAAGAPAADISYVTYTMGGVEDLAARDAIFAALRAADGPPLAAAVDRVREAHAWTQFDPAARDVHAAYLAALFWRLNHGARKKVLPRPLAWLRAPSGHQYGHGDRPAYRRADGPVDRIEVWVREAVYRPAARDWYVLSDELAIAVRPGPPTAPCTRSRRPAGRPRLADGRGRQPGGPGTPEPGPGR
jgi:hypothetical protein